MSNVGYQFSHSVRILRRTFAFACATSLLLASSAQAGTSTILIFAQLNSSDVVTATESGGVTTLSTAGNADGTAIPPLPNPPGPLSIPVLASTYLGASQPFGLLMYETFLPPGTGSGLVSSGSATGSPTVSQNFSGTIEFTANPWGSAGPNLVYLIATFSGPNGNFSGGLGGGSATLSASEPTDTVTFTVPFNVANPGSGASYTDAAIGLSFSGITPGLGTSGGSIAPFTAQGSGTFSAAIVPEPGTFCLGSLAIVIGTLAYRSKKTKN